MRRLAVGVALVVLAAPAAGECPKMEVEILELNLVNVKVDGENLDDRSEWAPFRVHVEGRPEGPVLRAVTESFTVEGAYHAAD